MACQMALLSAHGSDEEESMEDEGLERGRMHRERGTLWPELRAADRHYNEALV